MSWLLHGDLLLIALLLCAILLSCLPDCTYLQFSQIETENLVYGGRYDNREDFAVVVQPLLKNTVVPLNSVSSSLKDLKHKKHEF